MASTPRKGSETRCRSFQSSSIFGLLLLRGRAVFSRGSPAPGAMNQEHGAACLAPWPGHAPSRGWAGLPSCRRCAAQSPRLDLPAACPQRFSGRPDSGLRDVSPRSSGDTKSLTPFPQRHTPASLMIGPALLQPSDDHCWQRRVMSHLSCPEFTPEATKLLYKIFINYHGLHLLMLIKDQWHLNLLLH